MVRFMLPKKKRCRRRNARNESAAHIKWLARPRMGIITPKYICVLEEQRLEQGDNCPLSMNRPRKTTKRLRQLAEPVKRNITHKYDPMKNAFHPKPLNNIVRPPEISTRLDQLALPYVRLLHGTKTGFRPVMTQRRIGVLNKSIQKSLHTVYNRLANAKIPRPKSKRHKWGPDDWQRHNDWLASRAKPKRVFSDEHIVRQKRKINYKHVNDISRPRRPRLPYTDMGYKCSDPVSPISRAVLEFEMTPHYEQLATPFKKIPSFEAFDMYENPFDVPREYAKITTVGIQKLAEPRIKTKRFAKGDNASIVFEVSKQAMKCKPTEATIKLAQPRASMGEGPKPNAFDVKKTALKPLKGPKLEYYTKLSKPTER